MCCNYSEVVFNSGNRAVYTYVEFFTKTTIIGHYTVFHGSTPIFRWLQFV